MRLDTQAAYDRLGDWERVIASHFAGEGAQAGPKEDWNKVPGYDYNQNPSIWEYVHGVEGHIAEADPSEPRWLQTVWGVGYRWDPAPGSVGSAALGTYSGDA